MNFFKISADKIFWILLIFYLIWIAFYISALVTSMKYAPTKAINDNYFVMKMMVPVSILSAGIILKFLGLPKFSNWILGIPALIAGSIFLLSILVWVFLAVVFILFGKN